LVFGRALVFLPLFDIKPEKVLFTHFFLSLAVLANILIRAEINK
jgi:hypothetical protein